MTRLTGLLDGAISVSDITNASQRSVLSSVVASSFKHFQSIGIILASAFINYRLYRVTSKKQMYSIQTEVGRIPASKPIRPGNCFHLQNGKKRTVVLDLDIGLGVPAILAGTCMSRVLSYACIA